MSLFQSTACSLNLMAMPSATEAAVRPRDAAWRSIEEVGLSTHFPGAADRVPPLADVPQAIIDMVLLGGKSPQGEGRQGRRISRVLLLLLPPCAPAA